MISSYLKKYIYLADINPSLRLKKTVPFLFYKYTKEDLNEMLTACGQLIALVRMEKLCSLTTFFNAQHILANFCNIN